MIDNKVAALERQIKELSKIDEGLFTKIREIEITLDSIVQRGNLSQQEQNHSSTPKVEYLTEVNEQMFQQNIRLRQLIESCIESKNIPSYPQYYTALQGDC